MSRFRLVRGRIARHEGGRIVRYYPPAVVELTPEEAARYRDLVEPVAQQEPAPAPAKLRAIIPKPPTGRFGG